MEILQLQYFITAAKYQHITKAAASLHIAQPALSQSIKRLETELGVNLFIRSGRNIKLSPEGITLLDKVTPILKSLDSLPSLINDISEATDRTIHVNVLSASEVVTDLIIQFKKIHPETLFQISQSSKISDWDIKISSITSSSKDFSEKVALKEEIFMAVPVNSPYASKDSISLDKLSNESFICLDPSRPFTAICNNFCYSAGFEPKAAFESDSPSTVRKLIEAGLGVSFWPRYSWGTQDNPNVKLLTISSPKCTRQIYITQNKKSSSTLKKDFYHFIVDHFQEL